MISSPIQWTDDTVNPVIGCDGCELWPKNNAVGKAVVDLLSSQLPQVSKEALTKSVREILRDYTTADLFHYRSEYVYEIDDAVRKLMGSAPVTNVRHVFESAFKCYAGRVTDMRAGHKGYPQSFDVPAQFADRMKGAAKQSDLSGKARLAKPWLNQLPRLIFVSDMGDALSRSVPFDFLKREIIDVVTSEVGTRHIWLWLTKRPAQMVKFDGWLREQGIAWPAHLVAMTSVTNTGTLNRVDQLREVRAEIKGLSVEPLWEPVEIDLGDIDWCIVGGESGARDQATPFDLQWARSLRDQCSRSKTSFFLKQLGSNVLNQDQPQKYPDPHGGDWDQWPHDLRVREIPRSFYQFRQSVAAK